MRCRYLIRLCASCTTILLLCPSTVAPAEPTPPVIAPQPGGDEEILRKIFSDWTARRERFTSVRHSLEGETTLFKGHLNAIKDQLLPSGEIPAGDIPPTDLRFPFSTTVAIDFERGCARAEQHSSQYLYVLPTPALASTFEVHLFDGEWKQRYQPQDKNPDLGRLTPELTQGKQMPVFRGGFFNKPIKPLLYGHGFVPGSSDPEVLRKEVDNSRLYGVGHVMHDGRRCAVLRVRRANEYELMRELWVDVDRDSAVVRFSYGDGLKVVEVTSISYRKMPDGWMPDQWTTHTIGSRRSTVHLVRTERNPDLSAEQFRFEPSVGMIFKQGGKLWIHRGKRQKPLDARKHVKPAPRKEI